MDEPAFVCGVKRVRNLARQPQRDLCRAGRGRHAADVQASRLRRARAPGRAPRPIPRRRKWRQCRDGSATASALASRSNRSRRSGSLLNCGGSSLSATSRPNRGSRARYTSPIPPWPSFSTTRNGPKLKSFSSGVAWPNCSACGPLSTEAVAEVDATFGQPRIIKGSEVIEMRKAAVLALTVLIAPTVGAAVLPVGVAALDGRPLRFERLCFHLRASRFGGQVCGPRKNLCGPGFSICAVGGQGRMDRRHPQHVAG